MDNTPVSSNLIIKAALGIDIRKIPIVNDEITYDELLVMMQRIFKGKLHASDDVLMKYRDEDGDLVTISDDADLAFAVQCNRVLKVTLFVNDKPVPLETEEVKHIKKQLQQIRDLTNDMLDSLEPKTVFLQNGDVESADDRTKENFSKPQYIAKPMVNDTTTSCEFDPLHLQQHKHAEKTHGPVGKIAENLVGGGPVGQQMAEIPKASLVDVLHSGITEKQQANLVSQASLNAHESRPDTPSSTASRERSSSYKQPDSGSAVQQQDNVAMIQPSLHQQVNAPPLSQMASLNGPQPPAPPQPPYFSSGAPQPPLGASTVSNPPAPFQPPVGSAAAYGAAAQKVPPQPQMHFGPGAPGSGASALPPSSQYYGSGGPFPPPPGPPGGQPQQHQPTSQPMGNVFPQQQQQQGYPPQSVVASTPIMSTAQQQHQQSYSTSSFPPVPSMSHYGPGGHVAPHQQQQQQHVPPSNYAMTGGSSGMAPMAPPGGQQYPPQQQQQQSAPPTVGPPPMLPPGGGQSGANPFARVNQSPYIRPAYSSGYQ